MPLVGGRILAFGAREFVARGYPVGEWIAARDLTVEELCDPSRRVEWELMIDVLGRAHRHSGGPEVIEEVATGLWTQHSAQLMPILGMLMSPSQLYTLAERWLIPQQLPQLRVFAENQSGRVRHLLEFPPELKVTDDVWYATRGLYRGAPQALGLPEAIVTSDFDGNRATFNILPPESRSLASRVRRAYHALRASQTIVDDLGQQQTQLQDSFEQLTRAHDRMRAQANELRQSEARYRAVVDNSSDMILVFKPDGVLEFGNSRLSEVVGRPLEALVGTSLLDHVHPDDHAEASRPSDDSGIREFRILSAWGETRWFEFRGSWIGHASDRLLVVARDVTSRRRIEKERIDYTKRLEVEVAERTADLERMNTELRTLQGRLIRAERLGAARDLAGSVAHAINNPLTALIGHVELMIEGADDRPALPQRPKLERLLTLAQRISDVVSRTLQLFREGSLELASDPPSGIIRDVAHEVSALGRARDVKVETKVEPGLPPLRVDGPLLRAALVSLVENAIEVTPLGGTVWLEVGAIPALHVVEFHVADAGPGIAPELRTKVLEPFFTTKSAGTGLGLAIAQGIVAGHEGRMILSGRPGGGTVVTVELPVDGRREPVSARAS